MRVLTTRLFASTAGALCAVTLAASCGGGQPVAHGLSGFVTGDVVEGISVQLSGPASATAKTNVSGQYAFDHLATGTYTVQPVLAGYTFSPSSQTVEVTGASDASSVRFVCSRDPGTCLAAAPPCHPTDVGSVCPSNVSISGHVSGAVSGGVKITETIGIEDAFTTLTTVTDSSGNYSIPAAIPGAFGFPDPKRGITITAGVALADSPSNVRYDFTPESRHIDLCGDTFSGQDFVATAIAFHTISGVTQLSGPPGHALEEGVTINVVFDGFPRSPAFPFGQYSLVVPDGTYTLQPQIPVDRGYVFTPPSRTVVVNGADVSGQDFTAAPADFAVGGRLFNVSALALAFWRLDLNGQTAIPTRTPGIEGFYVFPGIANGTYTLTPIASTFCVPMTPVSRTVSVQDGIVGGQDFTAATVDPNGFHSISGNMTGCEATLILDGTNCHSVTGSFGSSYRFDGLSDGSYTITIVQSPGVAVSPAIRNVTISGGDVTGQDFGCTTTP